MGKTATKLMTALQKSFDSYKKELENTENGHETNRTLAEEIEKLAAGPAKDTALNNLLRVAQAHFTSSEQAVKTKKADLLSKYTALKQFWDQKKSKEKSDPKYSDLKELVTEVGALLKQLRLIN